MVHQNQVPPRGEIVAINLIPVRAGVPVEEFARFSATIDQPLCLAQDVVRGFEAFAVQAGGPGARDTTPIDIVEVMRVRSWPEWERVRDDLPGMRPVVAGFDQLVDAAAVRTLFATPILRSR
jgi:hypothetical protein